MSRRLVGPAVALVFLWSGITATQPTKPNDAQIAYTADEIDIKAAQQALQKSRNRTVREFAQNTVRDHTAVNRQALALVKQLHVTPQDNSTSQALLKQPANERKKLAQLNGPAFDRAYAQNEVAYHQAVNKALETPSSRRPLTRN